MYGEFDSMSRKRLWFIETTILAFSWRDRKITKNLTSTDATDPADTTQYIPNIVRHCRHPLVFDVVGLN
jgi:hypothetical protein